MTTDCRKLARSVTYLQTLPWLVPLLPWLWLLWHADGEVDDQERPRIAAVIWDPLVGRRTARAIRSFTDTSDAVFGRRLFSWRAFGMSAFMSIAVMVTWAITEWLLLRPVIAEALRTGSVLGAPSMKVYVRSCALAGLPAIAFDYVSVAQTRWVIRWIRDTSRPAAWVAALVTDAALSFALAILAMVSSMLFYGAALALFDHWPENEVWWIHVPTFWKTLEQHPSMMWDFLTPNPYLTARVPPAAIAAAPGFVTSAWLWLYLVGVFLARITVFVAMPHGFLKRSLRTDLHPLRALAILIGTYALLAHLVGAMFSVVLTTIRN